MEKFSEPLLANKTKNLETPVGFSPFLENIVFKSGLVSFLTLLLSITVQQIIKNLGAVFKLQPGLTDRQALLHRTSTSWVQQTSQIKMSAIQRCTCHHKHSRKTKQWLPIIKSRDTMIRVSQKKWPDFTKSYLKKYWIWGFQIFYSDLPWVKIVYWKIWCDYLILLKFCWYLKIS